MIPNRSMQKAKTKGERQGGASDGITGKANPTKEAKARGPRKAGGGESTRRGEKEREESQTKAESQRMTRKEIPE